MRAAETFRLGLTPVFLDNDAVVIERLRSAFSEAMGEPVDLIQRRTYQEITATILDGSVDAAWICGYPFLQHRESLSLLGVPVWLQTMVPLTAGDTVELQGYFRVADGYFAADHTSFWGCKVG
ncbi:hypothetical protein GCM10011316_38110 [Roseibium aquae]|uniref:Uncharacterized protein n=1 Tax=Roseibium aquae TaxID=1323746 RepID=A0A916TMY4_9HYPH|nr:hypothetical protein [Roseibium aquae]GGB62572.1 hypothetical protein GCM10011316_38110 [Roseibium aquae]